jgi:hypothetical protein
MPLVGGLELTIDAAITFAMLKSFDRTAIFSKRQRPTITSSRQSFSPTFFH